MTIPKNKTRMTLNFPAAASFLSLLLLLGSGCADERSRQLKAIAVQEAALAEVPKDLEIPTEEQRRLTTALIDQYQAFVQAFPDDTASGKFAFEAGLNLETLGKFNEAITWYDEVWKNRPEHRLAPIAYFRTGFISEKFLRDNTAARERYEGFAAAFPTHPLAENMDMQLRFLGNDEALLNAILSQKDSLEASSQTNPETNPETNP